MIDENLTIEEQLEHIKQENDKAMKKEEVKKEDDPEDEIEKWIIAFGEKAEPTKEQREWINIFNK